jgi:hypothetical protein
LVAVVALGFGCRQFLVYGEIAATTVSLRHMSDFSVFYESSRRVLEGRGDPYDPALVDDTWPNPSPNLNPPNFIVFMTPLAALPLLTAFSIWTTLSVASALLALRIFSKSSAYLSI